MPSKRNGKSACAAHPNSAVACRQCTLAALHNFRVAAVRHGIGLAVERATQLRSGYIQRGTELVLPSDLCAALGKLIADLEGVGERFGGLPTDFSTALEASYQVRGRGRGGLSV